MITGMYGILKRRIRIIKDSLLKPLTTRYLRKRLRNPDFTIIASNCIGAKMYQELGIEYNTPFVGLFIYSPCYIKLVSNLDHFLYSDITFKEESKYESANVERSNEGWYPIGCLDGEVELHFVHYKSEAEAEAKWKRRLQRMNMKNLFFTYTDRDECDVDHLNQFDTLLFKSKICFTANKHPLVTTSLHIPQYDGEPHVGDLYANFHILRRHFDFVDWLNGGKGGKH